MLSKTKLPQEGQVPPEEAELVKSHLCGASFAGMEDVRLRNSNSGSTVPESHEAKQQVERSDPLQRGTQRPLCEAMQVKLAERPNHVMSTEESCTREVEPVLEKGYTCCRQQSWRGGAA